jgi:hypothetical protein
VIQGEGPEFKSCTWIDTIATLSVYLMEKEERKFQALL